MNWLSKEQVIAELGLETADDSAEAILVCLRREMAELHPDKTDGQFTSTEKEGRWHKLVTAKEFIESLGTGQGAMIPIGQLPGLIKAIKDGSQDSITVRTSQLRNEYRGTLKQKTFVPKLTSGIVAGICGLIFTGANSFKEHPLFGPILSSPQGAVALFSFMLCAGILFVFFWWQEARAERYLEWLLTSEGTQTVLSRMMRRRDSTSEHFDFTFKDIVYAISGPRHSFYGPTLGRLDLPVAEKTARLMIELLKEEKIIHELPKRGLNQEFQVTKAVVKELKEFRDFS